MALTPLKLSGGPRRVSELVNMCTVDDGYMVDLNPPYQRGAVWTTEKQRKLIYSLLRGLRIGDVTINFRTVPGDPSKLDYNQRPNCVDGQQRIRALIAFFSDELAIPTEWVDDRGSDKFPMVPEDFTGQEIRFSELTNRGRMEIEGKTVIVQESRVETEADEAELFLLINFGGVAIDDRTRAKAEQLAGRVVDPPATAVETVPVAAVREQLDEMTLHDNTGDPRDEGYMAAVAELDTWLSEQTRPAA